MISNVKPVQSNNTCFLARNKMHEEEFTLRNFFRV